MVIKLRAFCHTDIHIDNTEFYNLYDLKLSFSDPPQLGMKKWIVVEYLWKMRNKSGIIKT